MRSFTPGRMPRPSRYSSKPPVALKYAGDLRRTAAGDFIQRLPAALAAVLRAIHRDPIAVRTRLFFTQFLAQAILEVGGDGVFHLLGFLVDLVPLHTENLRQHALDQVMAIHHAVGDFAALARERDFTGRRDADQAVALQAADGHGHRGRRNLEPAGQRGGDNHFAFAFGLRNGLQVILFGNGDAHSLVIVICAR